MTVASGGRRGLIGTLTFALALTLPLAFAAATPPRAKFTTLSPAPAPAIELRDTQGKLHRLSDYRGKVVLVNFWATWCEPCRDEMPSMQRLKERFDTDKRGGASLVILAVNYGESAANVDRFLKSVAVGFPVLLDPFSEVSRAWKPGVLPASFLVGRDGRMYYRVIGELDWSGAEAVSVIERLLDNKG